MKSFRIRCLFIRGVKEWQCMACHLWCSSHRVMMMMCPVVCWGVTIPLSYYSYLTALYLFVAWTTFFIHVNDKVFCFIFEKCKYKHIFMTTTVKKKRHLIWGHFSAIHILNSDCLRNTWMLLDSPPLLKWKSSSDHPSSYPTTQGSKMTEC